MLKTTYGLKVVCFIAQRIFLISKCCDRSTDVNILFQLDAELVKGLGMITFEIFSRLKYSVVTIDSRMNNLRQLISLSILVHRQPSNNMNVINARLVLHSCKIMLSPMYRI